MTQKLSELVRSFTGSKFPPIKTKVERQREVGKKAARTRKRLAALRAEAKQEQDVGKEAA